MHSKIYLNLFFGGWGGVLLGLGLVGMIVKGMKWNECYRTFRFVATKKILNNSQTSTGLEKEKPFEYKQFCFIILSSFKKTDSFIYKKAGKEEKIKFKIVQLSLR
jgi:hypothetical protein